MYAMVQTGGKQVKVAQGDRLRVEKIDAAVGDTVELDDVRFLAKDDATIFDAETLKNAKVVCQVTDQGRRKKIKVFKMKRRKNYHRTYGHRQDYTELKVEEIQG